jgi:hypothetical protein
MSSTVAADDAKDSTSVLHAGFIDLGSLKGNIGDQNYALGPEVDLLKYRAVSMWCKRFSVNFGTAGLMPDQAASQKGPLVRREVERRCRRSIATASSC